jgi:hypothetical protein
MARRSGRPNEVCWLFVVSKFGKKFVPIWELIGNCALEGIFGVLFKLLGKTGSIHYSRDRNSPARYNQLHSPPPRLSYENDARNSKNENATEDLTYQENVPFKNDNETIERIREAVVRETVFY